MKGKTVLLSAASALLVVAAAAPSGAVEAPTGSAEASSVLLRVTTGAGTASLGADASEAVGGDEPRAFAELVAGAAADQKVGTAQRTSVGRGEKGRQVLAQKELSIGDLLSLVLVNASVSTSVGDEVVSTVDAELGSIDVLGGLATIGGGDISSVTRVTDALARTQRTVTIGDLHTFALGDLLRALGSSPLDLACTAVEDVGSLMKIETSQVCENLDTAKSLIDEGLAAIQGAKADLLSVEAAVAAQVQSATTSKNSAEASRTALQAERTTLEAGRTTLESQRVALEAARPTLLAQQADLQAQTAGKDRVALQADRDAVAGLCAGLTDLALTLCQVAAMATTLPAYAAVYGVVLPGTFDAAQAAVLAAIDAELALFAQLDSVNAQLDANQQQLDTNQQQLDANAAQLVANQSQIDAAGALIASLQAQIDSANAQLDALVEAVATVDAVNVSDTTCQVMTNVLGTVAQAVPSAAPTLDPIRDNVGAVCGSLSGTLKALIEAPLISMDGVDIFIDAIARPEDPTVVVRGQVGELKIAGLAPISVDLGAAGASIAAVEAQVQDVLSSVTATLGLDVPLPTFEFFVVDSDTGQREDGTWFARGSVTAMRIQMPAATLTLPDLPPLSILNDGASLLPRPLAPSVARAPADLVGPAASLSAPAITLDLGTFQGSSTFAAPDEVRRVATLREPRTLPVTGVGGFGGFAVGALFLTAAAVLRRYLLAR